MMNNEEMMEGKFWSVRVGKRGKQELVPFAFAADKDELSMFLDDEIAKDREGRPYPIQKVHGHAYRINITENFTGPFRNKRQCAKALKKTKRIRGYN